MIRDINFPSFFHILVKQIEKRRKKFFQEKKNRLDKEESDWK